jgi:hypothetical protein
MVAARGRIDVAIHARFAFHAPCVGLTVGTTPRESCYAYVVLTAARFSRRNRASTSLGIPFATSQS